MYKTLKRGLTAFSITRGLKGGLTALPITRTLKGGLTALAILTAGGFAFAPTAAEAERPWVSRHNTPVQNCLINPWGGADSYQIWKGLRRVTRYYFTPGGCTHVLSQKRLSEARTKWCSFSPRDYLCRQAGTGIGGRAVNNRPNAANWADNVTHQTEPTTSFKSNQFVSGTENGINKGDVVTSSSGQGSLNLNTATFNDVRLNGDNTDGVAFIRGRFNNRGTYYAYAGIFSGTDLGAPVTETSGSASWAGSFKATHFAEGKDFVLEVTFGSHRYSNHAGSIEAFVQGTGEQYFHLTGDFASSGAILNGKVDVGNFTDNNRKSPTGVRYSGRLNGFIGKEGAVGVFISNRTGGNAYSGGFVAHPDAGQSTIRGICDKDPFDKFCHIGTRGKVALESLRSTRIAHCIQDDNAGKGYITSDVDCRNAVRHNPCIGDPFGSGCANNADFRTARENRLEFCNSNASNSLCMSTEATICDHVPFAPFCAGKTDYDTHRDTRVKICAANLNASGCGNSYYLPERKTCNLVPFGGACADDIYEIDRVTKAKTCAGNPNASGCDGTYYVDTSKICDLVPFIGTCLNNGDYKNKRIARADFCTTSMTDPVCNGIVTTAQICSQLPFHSDCTGNEGNDDQRLERARLCADDNGNDPFCDKGNVTTAHICSQLPFHSDCTDNDDERFERAKRCVSNPRDSLCRIDEVTPADICNQLPFRSGCTGNAGARLARANLCLLTTEVAPEGSRCHNDYVSTYNICSQRPFNAICDGLDSQRYNRAKLCVPKDNDDGTDPNPLCNKQYVNTAQICSQLPFHSTCSDDRYEPDRAKRITFCNDETSEGINHSIRYLGRCAPPKVVDAVCSANLFGTGCVNGQDPDGVYAAKRADRITICNQADGVSNDDCKPADVVAAICADNLFGLGCKNGADPDGSYERERTGHIKFCNREVNIGSLECTHKDVVDAVCNSNLFGTGCVSSPDPDGVYAGKRATELNFCIANPGKSGCKGTQRDDICRYTPFSPFCSNHADSEGNKTGLITFCNDEGNEGNYRCTGTQRDTICSHAPFSPVCSSHAASAGKRTESAFNACRNPGSSNSACHGIQLLSTGKADAAVWADSLITFDNREGIPSVTLLESGYAQRKTNRFLKDLQRSWNNPYFRPRNKTPYTVLTLADNLVDSTETLGGESEDGVVFFGLQTTYGFGNKAFPFYAGILPSTDLGAPITGTADTVLIWSGVFQALGGQGRAVKRNFDLTVDFTDGTTGTIDAFVQAKKDEHYHLTGTFNSVGVISGTVDYGLFTDDKSNLPTGDRLPGQLTGLIGEQGAVGAFIADMDNEGRGFYSGGFVARPTQ